MSNVKDIAKEVIDRLPDDAGWNDIMYELYVKQKIETGLAAAAEGRTVEHDELKRQLLGDANQVE
jgi:predicted transcriptional regulator